MSVGSGYMFVVVTCLFVGLAVGLSGLPCAAVTGGGWIRSSVRAESAPCVTAESSY